MQTDREFELYQQFAIVFEVNTDHVKLDDIVISSSSNRCKLLGWKVCNSEPTGDDPGVFVAYTGHGRQGDNIHVHSFDDVLCTCI